jgi:hypothetical protein
VAENIHGAAKLEEAKVNVKTRSTKVGTSVATLIVEPTFAFELPSPRLADVDEPQAIS